MNIVNAINVIKNFAINKVDSISISNPMIGFLRPVILRVIDNNINKIAKPLSLIADSQGNIDVENIIPEMIQSVMTVEPFTIPIDVLGDVIVGGGKIVINIPMTGKQLVLGNSDFEEIKNLLK